MKKIINFMLDNKLLASMLLIFIFLFGVISMNSMNQERFPSVSLNIVTITTVYPGAAPEDVELNVTVPIERELRSVSGISEIKSTSTENVSVITIQANDDLGPAAFQKVLDDIKSAVDRVDNLPDGLDGRPVVQDVDVEKFPIVQVALFGDMKKLRPYAKALETQMRTLPGVSTINKVGYFDTEVHVEINPWLMEKHHISFDEVINSIRTRNIRTSGGSLNSYIGKKSIVTLSKFHNLMDINRVILRSNFEMQRVLLSDVAKIRITEEDTKLSVRNNGVSGISLTISKNPSADVVTTVNTIKDFMKKQQIPEGIAYQIINDNSNATRKSVKSVINNGIVGIILVLLILILFLNFRTAAWCAFSIPFSLALSFALMPLFGMTINMISMAGLLIVLGMLVDDAIVTSEHIEKLIEEGMDPKDAARKGASEMVGPITAAVLTTIAAYVPLFFLGGKAGKFIWPIPVTVSLTLLASLFDTFFLLPGHLAHKPKNKTQKGKAGWLKKLESMYKRVLGIVLKNRKIYITSIAAIFLFSIFIVAGNMKLILFPNAGTDVFYIKLEAPQGSSLRRTETDVTRMEQLLNRIKKQRGEILSFTSRMGHYDSRGQEKNSGSHENRGIITVYLTHPDKRKRSAAEIISQLRKQNTISKNTVLTFEEKIMGPSSSKPVEIRVMSNREKDREAAVQKISGFLKQIKGLYDLNRDDKSGKKQLQIHLRYDRLAAYGLTSMDVASLLRIAFDGQKVTSIQTLDEEIWYRVILAPQFRGTENSIKHLKVRNKTGQLVSLRSLVTFRTTEAKQDLFHYNGMKCVTISAEVDNKNATAVSVARLLNKKLLKTWTPPLGTVIDVGGQAKETRDTMQDFILAFFIAVLAIFFIVTMVLKNLYRTGIVLSMIPLAFIGVSTALFIHGMPFSLFGIMGLLGLAGIVVNDSIVMIDQFSKKIDPEKASIEDITKQAAERLRPILMTTTTTVFALLPAAYGLGGSDTFITQLSVSVGYGLIFSSLMTLFTVPALYWGHCRKVQRKKARAAGKNRTKPKKKCISPEIFFGSFSNKQEKNGGTV